MAKVHVVLNETHSLMDEQVEILNANFGSEWEILPVAKDGWTAAQQQAQLDALADETLVFASPLPYMVKAAARRDGDTYVFHNDHRQKKELPNGKIIMVVSETGWQLL